MAGANSYEIQRFNPSNQMVPGAWQDLKALLVTPVLPTAPYRARRLRSPPPARTANTTYLYRVRMVKEEASRAAGLTSRVARLGPWCTIAPPTLVTTTTGQSMIRLSWTAVDGATAYHLEFLEGPQNGPLSTNPNTNPTRRTIGGNFNNYVHTGLKAGTQYSYRLRAVLPSGEGTVDSTRHCSRRMEVQPFTKPATPDLAVAATSSTTLTLTWDAVTFGADHHSRRSHLSG